jgi:hypothetical protein
MSSSGYFAPPAIPPVIPRTRSPSIVRSSSTGSLTGTPSPRSSDSRLGPTRSCVKRARRASNSSGKPTRSVRFADSECQVIGRADAGVDRTPRGEPSKCSCCGLHVVGYSFECLKCASGEDGRREYSLCAMCFAAHAQLSATPALARMHGITYVIHDHEPGVFARGGDEDQMILDEILNDRRVLMVNGSGAEEVSAAVEGKSTEREPSAGSDESDLSWQQVCASTSV